MRSLTACYNYPEPAGHFWNYWRLKAVYREHKVCSSILQTVSDYFGTLVLSQIDELKNTSSAHGPTGSLNPLVSLQPSLNPNNFPNCKFWSKDAYSGSSKKKVPTGFFENLSKPKDNVMTYYFKDSDGITVSKTVVTEGTYFHSIMEQFGTEGVLPATFSQLGVEAENRYLGLMETHFPFLCYCASHWKAKQIGTGNYSSWKSYYDHCQTQTQRDRSETPSLHCCFETPSRCSETPSLHCHCEMPEVGHKCKQRDNESEPVSYFTCYLHCSRTSTGQ